MLPKLVVQEPEELFEIVFTACVILLISFILTLAWMSTYVRDQIVVGTALVVIQQESSPSQTTNSNTDESVSTSTSQSSGDTSNQASSQEPEMEANPTVEEEKPPDNLSENKTKAEETDVACNVLSSSDASETASDSVKVRKVELNKFEDRECKQKDNFKSASSSPHQEETVTSEERSSTNTSSDNASNVEAELHYEELPQDSIRIKLKFLDDTQRLVRGQLTDEVGSFKRANFTSELSSNRVIRLIFNGQLLNRDRSTLGQYGLFDNCVVHCHVSQPQSSAQAGQANQDAPHEEDDGLDLSPFLGPLLLVILAFLWYLRFEYAHLFNNSATMILICLTLLLLISQYALFISLNILLFSNGESPVSNNIDGGSQTNSNENSDSELPAPELVQESVLSSSPHGASIVEEVVPDNAERGAESSVRLRSQQVPLGDTSFPHTNHAPNADSILLNS